MKPDKIYLSLTLIFFLTIFSWISSCTHTANIADVPEICFTGDIKNIFTNSCAIPSCHDGTGESHLTLDNYPEISSGVVPGNPGSSNFYQVIISKWGDRMPPNEPLSLENRTKIRIWIEQGAGPTTCPDITGTGGNGGGNN